MRGTLWIIGALAAALALPCVAEAKHFVTPAEDLRVEVGGAFQPRVTWGRTDGDDPIDRFGFGIRRARLRVSGAWADRVGVSLDVDLVGPEPFDLHMFWQVADGWRLRAGYLAGPQPRGLIPTGLTVIDGFDRAAIADRWGQRTIGGSGRDLGVELQHSTARTEVAVWVHSGLGGLDRGAGNFWQAPSNRTATGGIEQTGLAVAGSAHWTPVDRLEIGAFGGYNAAEPERAGSRAYATWAAHVYWGPEPGSQFIRLKGEVIGLRFAEDETEDGAEIDAQHSIGWAATAAAGVIPHGEIYGRFEQLDEDGSGALTVYATAGVMWSPSALRGGPFSRERLTLAYSVVTPEGDGATDEHMVVLQGQWLF